uniref:Minor tail protein n=1 Tax=Siphoviridae sp. ctiJI15 TaxID=2826431 RepID=A0A8S5NL63_9CAUD|nr:MAG TPA: minor tail protein [Siphoviridae sp. ctiJI15]
MTVEEIEIIVTAKVEEALKEFQKILPTIKQAMKQAQEAFSKVDTKTMTNKLHQAVNFMKKKMQDLKKSSENNEIAIKVNNKDAQKQISQIQKQIDSLQEKINARQMKLNVINPQIDKIVDDTRKNVTPEGINPNNKAMDTTVNNALNSNKDFTSLNSQAQKLYTEIEMYNKQLEQAKNKMSQLEQETSKTAITQNKMSSFFSAFKQKIEQVKPSMSSIKNTFSKMPNIGQNLSKVTQNVTNNIKGMSTGIKNGLGHVLKYAGALVSLQSIYSILSGCAQSWLSSQNAGAKQLSANIDYMKYAMGSAFAPVIQYVTGLVYQLMKAIQSVVYALFRVNIFAKASANSYASMAGSAKKAKKETKSLSNIHSEINNVQSNDNSDSGSGGSSSPSFDLSGIENQMSPLAQKLYDFFKPLVDSWNKYGPTLVEQIKTTAGQVTTLISAVWGSFEKIITNGTVYTSLELILAIIGNIAEAFANAWNYNGNGDAIVQNLANAFNNLLTAINNVVQSEGFQNWLNNCSDKFRVISEKLAEIDWQPLVDALSNIGQNIGTLALDILSGLVDIFKWLVENPIVAEIILGIAVAIGVLSTAYSIWATVTGVLTAVSTALNIAILPLVAIIAGIVAVIALVVVAIMNWGAISEWLGQKFQEAKEAITNAFQNIGQWFSDRWNDICNAFSDVGNWFKEKFNNAKEGVQNAFQNVGNWFGDRKRDITNTFSNIGSWFKGKFQDAYNGIRNVFSNIGSFFGNIWNGIKNTFSALGTKIGNAISGAVKSGINGVISLIERTINSAIRLINGGIRLINLIPGVYVGSINTLSLPRLAKGGVLTEATTVIAGEYSGAKTNPEIVTPQNIMRDTFEDVLSNYSGNNNDRPIYLTVNVGDKKLGQILLDDLRDKKRRTGKDIEALVGG